MDLLYSKDPLVFNKPQLIRIGNSVYRHFPQQQPEKPEAPPVKTPTLKNEFVLSETRDPCAEECDEYNWDIDVNITKTGKFLTYFHFPPCLRTRLIEALENNKIDEETKTRFKMPKSEESSDIEITGVRENDVRVARIKLKMLVLNIKTLYEETYLLTVPIISYEIRDNYDVFKIVLPAGNVTTAERKKLSNRRDSQRMCTFYNLKSSNLTNILNDPPMRGVDESIFISVDRLHLRIGSFALLDIPEVEQAAKIMEECKNEIIVPLFKHTGIHRIIFEGLEIMDDDPTRVRVLYGKVKLKSKSNMLTFQKMAHKFVDYFSKKGIMLKQKDVVKMHVALMDSWGRPNDSEHNDVKRKTFDCTEILKNYENFFFGKADFDNVHLSARFTTTDDRYYESEVVLQMVH